MGQYSSITLKAEASDRSYHILEQDRRIVPVVEFGLAEFVVFLSAKRSRGLTASRSQATLRISSGTRSVAFARQVTECGRGRQAVADVWPPDSNWQPLALGPEYPTLPKLDAGDVIMKSPRPVARDKNDELERALCFLSPRPAFTMTSMNTTTNTAAGNGPATTTGASAGEGIGSKIKSVVGLRAIVCADARSVYEGVRSRPRTAWASVCAGTSTMPPTPRSAIALPTRDTCTPPASPRARRTRRRTALAALSRLRA
jgi:hypothetical protein